MSCPICQSEAVRWSGVLGRLLHLECRDCGMQYSHRMTDEEMQELEELATAGSWGDD